MACWCGTGGNRGTVPGLGVGWVFPIGWTDGTCRLAAGAAGKLVPAVRFWAPGPQPRSVVEIVGGTWRGRGGPHPAQPGAILSE